jgi:flagellar biogenesis protein FliO
MVTLAIAYVCSPLFDTDPIAAYGTLFAVLLVLGVLGWLFRRRD